MTVEDYMKLPKKRLAELLVERDRMGGIVLPVSPKIAPYFCDGTNCNNPHHDCINCPKNSHDSYIDEGSPFNPLKEVKFN